MPAKRLLETLRALPNLPINFSSNEEFHVELTTDQGRYKMVGFDGADYPAIPSFEGGKVIEIGGALLKRTIQKTGFAASKDASQLPAAFDLLLDEEGQIRSIAFSAIREIMPEGEQVAYYGYQPYLPDTVRVGMVERLEALWSEMHPRASDPGAADLTKEAERG